MCLKENCSFLNHILFLTILRPDLAYVSHYQKMDQDTALLTLEYDFFQKVAAKKNESLRIIDMFNLFTLNTLVKETTLGIRSTPSQTATPSYNASPSGSRTQLNATATSVEQNNPNNNNNETANYTGENASMNSQP